LSAILRLIEYYFWQIGENPGFRIRTWYIGPKGGHYLTPQEGLGL